MNKLLLVLELSWIMLILAVKNPFGKRLFYNRIKSVL